LSKSFLYSSKFLIALKNRILKFLSMQYMMCKFSFLALKRKFPSMLSSNLWSSLNSRWEQSRIFFMMEFIFSLSFKSLLKCLEMTIFFSDGLSSMKWLLQFSQKLFLSLQVFSIFKSSIILLWF